MFRLWTRLLVVLALALQMAVAAGLQTTVLANTAASCAAAVTPTDTSASSSLDAGHLAAKATDSKTATSWSSAEHSVAASSEWFQLTFPDTFVNVVTLTPLSDYSAFPSHFQIEYLAGAMWVSVPDDYGNFPQPTSGDALVLPLRTEVETTGIRIVATTLRLDSASQFAFAVAEASISCNPEFDPIAGSWVYQGNSGGARIDVQNMSAGAFNPHGLVHWDLDVRERMIAAVPGSYQNIYAPNVVWDGTHWQIYYSGWDGESIPRDHTYRVSATSDFSTFDNRLTVITPDQTMHAGNPNVVKVGSTWKMLYTQGFATGRIAPASSTNGANWSPNNSQQLNEIQMTGYPTWNTANVNGNSAMLWDGTKYVLYFSDISNTNTTCLHEDPIWPYCGMFRATSPDGVNFTFTGLVSKEYGLVDDVKEFTYGAQKYDLAAYAWNLNQPGAGTFNTLRYSLTSDEHSSPASKLLLQRPECMPTMGWVTRDNRLLGALYGATPVSGTCDSTKIGSESITGLWLQKQATFASTDSTVNLTTNEARGPDTVVLNPPSNAAVTGAFTLRDTDASTLLRTTPTVTTRPGDMWSYGPPTAAASPPPPSSSFYFQAATSTGTVAGSPQPLRMDATAPTATSTGLPSQYTILNTLPATDQTDAALGGPTHLRWISPVLPAAGTVPIGQHAELSEFSEHVCLLTSWPGLQAPGLASLHVDLYRVSTAGVLTLIGSHQEPVPLAIMNAVTPITAITPVTGNLAPADRVLADVYLTGTSTSSNYVAYDDMNEPSNVAIKFALAAP